MSWLALSEGDPELAAFGRERFGSGVAYLATVRRDGGPRIHPVTPILSAGQLFLFMEPTSPKGHDLRRDGRYALHAAVEDAGGGGGEFHVVGRARVVQHPEVRSMAVRHASYDPAEHYVLFELDVESAFATVYEDGQPVRRRWRQSQI
jgi:hypothetical protein